MFGLFGKRTSPLPIKRWVKRQTWLTIGVFLLTGILFTITSFILNSVEPAFYFGLIFIAMFYLFNILFLRSNVKDTYAHYVATFKKDKSVAIFQQVIWASYLRDVGLVAGVLLVVIGLFFTFTGSSSLRQQDIFGGEPAPKEYTWVVFNPPNGVPEGRELVLRTGRREPVYFLVEEVWQDSFGFLVPDAQLDMRNLNVLLVPIEMDGDSEEG